MLIPAAFVFLLSGVAALTYQVVWQRMLAIFSGVDIYSTTVVVAVFMAGLGCGTLAGGFLADRLRRVACLVLFAMAEAGIAVFGFISAFLLYDIVHGRLGHIAASSSASAILLFAILLWPTLLMGMSLPLLSRALVRHVDGAAGIVGWLYAANTLGAAVGALGTTWVLMPRLGMEGALDVAASVNVVCAIAAVPLAVVLRRTAVPETSSRTAPIGAAARIRPRLDGTLIRWMFLYGLAGFIALSFEILWIRMLGVMLKSTSFTFGTLLAQYLLWLGIGSAIGSAIARRFERPGTIFLWAQTAAAVYAGLVIAVLVRLLPESASLAWLYQYLGSFEPVGQPFRRYVLLSAVVIGPATFLMGLAFPFLQRAVQTDLAYLGRRLGSLLVANIAGSTVGTIVTGWVLLGRFGTSGTMRTLIGLSGVFALLALMPGRGRSSFVRPAIAIALVATAVVAVPGGHQLWSTLHGADPRVAISAEDGSGVSLLKGRVRDFSGGVLVFVNGLGQSWLPYGGVHSELGALPAMIHPEPREAAVIGLGSGDTLFSIAGRRELERITSIEIVGPQLDTLRALRRTYPDPALNAWLDDARIEHAIDDGRAYVRSAGRQFDIVEADALRPTSAFAGNLYSEAYFRLLRDRLKPGGLAVTWVPTDRVQRTFLRVFPYAIRFGDILMGSTDPIDIDYAAVHRRLADPATQRYYSLAGLDIRALVESRLQSAVRFALSDAERAAISDINTDLYPRDEIARP